MGDDLLVSYGDKYFKNETKLKMRDMLDCVKQTQDMLLSNTDEDTGSDSEEMLQLTSDVQDVAIGGSPSKNQRPERLPSLKLKSSSV